ncbi:hypothetical protein B0H14DRAFT_2579363 [Mycena olivaceomarginata]|nr:hypothetical protein B0H14DRAFT_2579363 [Mycena olivaceomarginata]
MSMREIFGWNMELAWELKATCGDKSHFHNDIMGLPVHIPVFLLKPSLTYHAMTPKLCSAETMLWFYLKQAELALGEPWLYILGYTLAILPLQRLNNPLVEAQRNEDFNSLPLPSSLTPTPHFYSSLKSIFNIIESSKFMFNNEYQPRTPLVLDCVPTSAGTSSESKPNYFRRSQVKLDLVHSATTSPNPDSRSARPIQVHFNNFHLQLNYSGLKFDVPGTRLITSQVMLNYHTLIYILKTTFIRLKDRSYGTINQRLSHLTGTYAHSETPLTSNSHPVSSRHKLGRPNSLPPDFTYGLHTETLRFHQFNVYHRRRVKYILFQQFLYFYRRFHACLSYRLEGNAQASEFIFDDKSTTVHLPERRRIILTQRPQSSNGRLDNIGPFFLGETPPQYIRQTVLEVLVHALNSASSAGWSFLILCPPQHRLKFLPLKQKLWLAMHLPLSPHRLKLYVLGTRLSPAPGAGAVARALSEIFPNLRSISCAGIRGAISRGWRELEALLPEFVATRVKENSGTVIDPEVTVFTLAAPCPSRPDVVFVGRANIAVSDIWHEDSVNGIHQRTRDYAERGTSVLHSDSPAVASVPRSTVVHVPTRQTFNL